MAKNDFSGVSPDNYQEKTICCFVVDVSGSMRGKPIKELNEGLKTFHKDIKTDRRLSKRLEVSIITFNEVPKTVLKPSLVSKITMPKLQAGGTTAMVDGVREGINMVMARKEWYKKTGQPYKRPWIVLLTDGVPDDGQDIIGLAKEIQHKTGDKTFAFLGIGVEGADMSILETLSGTKIFDINNFDGVGVMKLKEFKFAEFFRWLQNSIEVINNSNQRGKNLPDPKIPDVGSWGTFKL